MSEASFVSETSVEQSIGLFLRNEHIRKQTTLVSSLQFEVGRRLGSNGTVQDIKLPEVWGTDSNIKWKAAIQGEGWSAPIIVGQKILTHPAFRGGCWVGLI